MTTLIVVDAPGDDINKTIARRIREELARLDTNINRIAKASGAAQQRYTAASRRDVRAVSEAAS